MRRMLMIFVLTIAAPVSGQPVDDTGCDDPQTQAEMNGCAYERLQKADAELNREWANLRTRLKQAEDDLGYEGWFDATLEGQRGWLAYRDGQCAAEGYGARGGTMEGMLITYCKTRLTNARVKELRELGDFGGLGAGSPVAGTLTVETLEAVHTNGTLYRFPQIGGDTRASARINTYLQTQLLERTPGDEEDIPFARVWPEEGSSHGLVSLDYTLSFEQPGILKVEVFREFYGAYLTSEFDAYHFDASTGQLITLRDLLTPEGLAQVDADIRDRRLKQIDDFLAGKEVNGAWLRSDPLEAEEQQLLYQECRSYIVGEHATQDDAFQLGQYSYELVREPCGPKAQWALLDLDLSVDRGFEMDSDLLNEYGRCLLLERRARCHRSDDAPAPKIDRESTDDRDSQAKTTIGSLQIGQGDETATFSNVRSSCGMLQVMVAFGTAAAPIRQCLGASDVRRLALIAEDGRITSSSVEPDDSVGRCVVSALSRAHIDGLTCRLEADVSR